MDHAGQPSSAVASDRPIACLGEAIVDLICERNLEAGEQPDHFIPWPGGALANVAVAAARSGVPAALIGGVGSDRWGRWLAEGLEREGVSTAWLARLESSATPVALAEFDAENEPSFQVYGEHIGPTMAAASVFLDQAIDQSAALVIGSNTMVGETEREVTRRAVRLAGESGLPVLFDPNYRPNRWDHPRPAREHCLELARSATVIKLNRGEARLITGIDEPWAAARHLAGLGPELVVVTDGAGEVITAGAIEVRQAVRKIPTVSPLGAGDAFMGALAAGLARSEWDCSAVGSVLPDAIHAAASACAQWGAQ